MLFLFYLFNESTAANNFGGEWAFNPTVTVR
jgi:hypothetical protein